MNKPSIFIVSAAGGNPTAIRLLAKPESSAWYAKQGSILMRDTASFEVEQAGFLIPAKDRFEMSGGEFCGNAARSAALLLSRFDNTKEGVFRMSGYDGSVRYSVQSQSEREANVTCVFDQLPIKMVDAGEGRRIVDLGGIVHIVINAALPLDYETQHRELTRALGLSDRAAVGVCWVERKSDFVLLHPVVWVKAIDSFFYETSCGSGSIVAAVVTGAQIITQPSGEAIEVVREGNKVSLQSRMEVIHER